MASINRVVLCGAVGQYGIEVRYSQTGAPCAAFQLQLTERGADGREHLVYIPCEVWGKRAESASEIEAGVLCLFEGKLAKRKKGETWELFVSGYDLQPLMPAARQQREGVSL